VPQEQWEVVNSNNMNECKVNGGDTGEVAKGGTLMTVGVKEGSLNSCPDAAEDHGGLAEVVRKHSNPLANVVSPPLVGSKPFTDDDRNKRSLLNHVRSERCVEHIVRGQRFLLPERYKICRYLGNGSYGSVLWCHDAVAEESVAVKKVRNAFRNTMDAKRTLREIKIGRSLQHENVVRVLDVFIPYDQAQLFDDVYIVFPLYDTDLWKVLSTQKQQLNIEHFQYFMYQLLRGMKYVHSAGVIHRDMKPSNILLKKNCDLVLADFGLARVQPEDESTLVFPDQTEYVATRWYRAPEIMLGWKRYNKKVDVWSLGCIFAEMLQGSVLFAGKSYTDQLTKILTVVGSPSDEILNRIAEKRASLFVKTKLPKFEGQSLLSLFPEAPEPAVDLLSHMIAFDPRERWSCEQCLAHPFFSGLHDPTDEPTATKRVDSLWEADDALTATRMRSLVLEEIQHFAQGVDATDTDLIAVCNTMATLPSAGTTANGPCAHITNSPTTFSG